MPATFPGIAGLVVHSATVPAVSSYTVSHGLGRAPAGVTFYDFVGNACEVGIVIVDSASFDVLQDNPTAGMVVFV